MATTSNDIAASLRQRAAIRRQIETRKSVQEGRADKIADLCDAAAAEIERLREAEERSSANREAALRWKNDLIAATRDRDEWRARAERAEARFKAMEQQYENAMDAIHRNAGARRDGLCGILAWIDTVKAERDSARALLREARVAVDLWTDDHRCGEDVSLKPDYAAQLRARIDAEVK